MNWLKMYSVMCLIDASFIICQGRNLKELMKSENWQEKVCEKISSEKNFPNKDIVDMYLRSTNEDFFSGSLWFTLIFYWLIYVPCA